MSEIQKLPYVLLVEDDEDLREQMSEFLRDEGHEVMTLENGKKAFEYLSKLSNDRLPSCMILDLMMPHMSGDQLLEKMKTDLPQLARFPVIVASAKGSSTGALDNLPAWVEQMKKPLDIEEFLGVVSKYSGPAKRL